jgi:hypothetical protein
VVGKVSNIVFVVMSMYTFFHRQLCVCGFLGLIKGTICWGSFKTVASDLVAS